MLVAGLPGRRLRLPYAVAAAGYLVFHHLVGASPELDVPQWLLSTAWAAPRLIAATALVAAAGGDRLAAAIATIRWGFVAKLAVTVAVVAAAFFLGRARDLDSLVLLRWSAAALDTMIAGTFTLALLWLPEPRARSKLVAITTVLLFAAAAISLDAAAAAPDQLDALRHAAIVVGLATVAGLALVLHGAVPPALRRRTLRLAIATIGIAVVVTLSAAYLLAWESPAAPPALGVLLIAAFAAAIRLLHSWNAVLLEAL